MAVSHLHQILIGNMIRLQEFDDLHLQLLAFNDRLHCTAALVRADGHCSAVRAGFSAFYGVENLTDMGGNAVRPCCTRTTQISTAVDTGVNYSCRLEPGTIKLALGRQIVTPRNIVVYE